MTASDERRWTMDRRISIILVLTVAVQTGFALVWAGEAHERFIHLEREVERQSTLNDRTVRLEEKWVALRDSLSRIEVKLDRIGSTCQTDRPVR